ncbi:MAG: hypothetical protein F6K42_03670 [Leptolyngbya sp. SIO1D8]|nr:hypothetical protein [Leptolyngbya sp. SIO1D8]
MITLDDFHAYLNVDDVNHVMRTTCQEAIATPESMHLFMQRFVRYSSAYSHSVPLLCGTIGMSKHFQDHTVAIPSHADRSMDVAAQVFSASIEEFRDPRTGVSHRTLAYALLDRLAEYAGLSATSVQQIVHAGDWLTEMMMFVQQCYQAESHNLEQIIRAMGFHAAAETIGGNEFSIIDSVLFSSQREGSFGQFIKNRKVHFQEGVVSPWYWIVIHGTATTNGVELGHADDAIQALNLAAQYSSVSEAQIIRWAGQGVRQLATIQTQFFQRVQQELRAAAGLPIAV